MKRMRNFILLSVIICLSIGSFYIYSAAHASGLPEFYLKKEMGNEQEIQSIRLAGSLTEGTFSTPLTITNAGTKYDSELSFMDKFSREFGTYNNDLDTYRKKYRSFMRNKQGMNSFFEDNKSIAFAGINYKVTNRGLRDFTFVISTLNKDSKKETKFTDVVPKASRYNMIDVADVQKRGNELDVMTTNYLDATPGDQQITEIHHYRFDLQTQKLFEDETIMSVPEIQGNDSVHVFELNESNMTALGNYFVFCKQFDPANTENDGAQQGEIKREYYAYHYGTKNVSKISFTSKENGQGHKIQWYTDANIYFTEMNDKGVEVLTYNIKKDNVVNKWKVTVPGLKQESDSQVMVNHNRLYISSINNISSDNNEKNDKSKNLLVTNLEGKVLYKGKIAVKKAGTRKSPIDALQIFSVEIK